MTTSAADTAATRGDAALEPAQNVGGEQQQLRAGSRGLLGGSRGGGGNSGWAGQAGPGGDRVEEGRKAVHCSDLCGGPGVWSVECGFGSVCVCEPTVWGGRDVDRNCSVARCVILGLIPK